MNISIKREKGVCWLIFTQCNLHTTLNIALNHLQLIYN